MSKTLDWSKFTQKFHPSWLEKLESFFLTEEAYNLYQFLKKRSAENYEVMPRSDRTFGIFHDVPVDKIRLLIIAQEPYSGYTGNRPQGNGVALDCSFAGERVQPSLEYFYYCLQNNFPTQDIVQSSSLKKYTDQGVFLTNASLTVEKNAIGTHLKLKKEEFATKNLWAKFWQYVWENIFNDLKNVPVILMGKAAQQLEGLIDPFRFQNRIFKVEHSSYAARTFDKEWNADMCFLKANNYIEQNRGKDHIIQWGKPKEFTPF